MGSGCTTTSLAVGTEGGTTPARLSPNEGRSPVVSLVDSLGVVDFSEGVGGSSTSSSPPKVQEFTPPSDHTGSPLVPSNFPLPRSPVLGEGDDEIVGFSISAAAVQEPQSPPSSNSPPLHQMTSSPNSGFSTQTLGVGEERSSVLGHLDHESDWLEEHSSDPAGFSASRISDANEAVEPSDPLWWQAAIREVRLPPPQYSTRELRAHFAPPPPQLVMEVDSWRKSSVPPLVDIY